ncbi:autophagy-related protein [Cantharellus anzutake]|uniref:autophagy-related protein n=1 Tax=Cantharellus anzutake TaxID=1750568 RepID=UPI001905D810|nr:autophagy-related protein [Cantharellus anzutake]KAF8330193.1 autophagy-related protein [Cantharellus anzutake]
MDAVHDIKIDLTLDRAVTRDVLRALLHAILFHRLFGTVQPRCIEVLDITFPGITDSDIERKINDKVDLFWKTIDSSGLSTASPRSGELIITFSEKREKRQWFSMTEEYVPWEVWTINTTIRVPRNDKERREIMDPLPGELSEILKTILNKTSSEKGRSVVPPIHSANVITPFPLSIRVRVSGTDVGGPD